MARLPLSRVSGIVAWTAASLTWGTATVAVANEAPGTPEKMLDFSSVEPVVAAEEVVSPLPTMPEEGLLVLRYTPAERPEAKVVVRTVTVSGSSSGKAPAPKAKPKQEKSSGS